MFGNARKLLTGGKGSFGIMYNKKALSMLVGLGLAAGLMGGSATASAASADSFTDVPKDHWSYEALDYLAKEGVIEGMGDNTFQGGRTMTRYEMASIVAKAMQKGTGNYGDKAVLDKLSAEYADELSTLNKKVDANTKAIKALNAKTDKFKIWGLARAQVGNDNGLVSDGHNATYNNRFYMDLEGSMKINDYATARFTIEKNAHYRDSEYANSKIPKVVSLTRRDGTMDHISINNAITGVNKDSLLGDDNHNGSISNIWVETAVGPKHDWYVNVGRKWNGIGMQNLMLGGQVDGVAAYHPIEKGHGWWLSAQYWKPSADWTNMSGTDTIKETFNADGTHKGWDTSSVKFYTHRAPVVGTLDFWGPVGKYIDMNIAYSRVVSHTTDVGNSNDGYYTGAKNFYGIDVKAKLFKDFSVTGSYLKSDALMHDLNWLKPNADRTWAVRFDYRGTDINKIGSWGVYAKWAEMGAVSDIGHDDEWATREPSFVNGIKGWFFGFKCVPAHNVEWETMWAPHLTENSDANWAGGAYSRHILRSWLDFHF